MGADSQETGAFKEQVYYSMRFSVVILLAAIGITVCAGAADADPIKGAALDVFGGPVATTPSVAPKIVDMKAYCRAHLDIVATDTFSGTMQLLGSASLSSGPWFPIDVPAPYAITAQPGTFNVHAGPNVGSHRVFSLDFSVPQLYLMVALPSVNSGQGGGTVQAVLTPQPC